MLLQDIQYVVGLEYSTVVLAKVAAGCVGDVLPYPNVGLRNTLAS